MQAGRQSMKYSERKVDSGSDKCCETSKIRPQLLNEDGSGGWMLLQVSGKASLGRWHLARGGWGVGVPRETSLVRPGCGVRGSPAPSVAGRSLQAESDQLKFSFRERTLAPAQRSWGAREERGGTTSGLSPSHWGDVTVVWLGSWGGVSDAGHAWEVNRQNLLLDSV